VGLKGELKPRPYARAYEKSALDSIAAGLYFELDFSDPMSGSM